MSDEHEELDLTPRTSFAEGSGAAARGPRRARRFAGVAVLMVVLAVGGFAVANALGDSSLYFYNVDEAVDQAEDLDQSRFHVQGLVVAGSVQSIPGGVTFSIAFNDVEAEVDHTGDPVELFADDIPVVLEGQWSGTGEDRVFVSDRMLVRHDENYEAEHGDRIEDAEDGHQE